MKTNALFLLALILLLTVPSRSKAAWKLDCAPTGGDCLPGTACYPLGDGAYDCLNSDELPLGQACDPEQSDALACEDGSFCVATIDGTPTCRAFCLGPEDCQPTETCPWVGFDNYPDLGVCVPEAVPCSITGGDCDAGHACFLDSESQTTCFPSDGLGAGESCNPDMGTWDSLPCADGLLCLQVTETDGQCKAFCTSTSVCEGTDTCVIPVFEGIEDVGICAACTDGDGDGACADVDCADDDDTVFPGAEELCDDGRDNDCDGALDALDDACDEVEPDPDGGTDGGTDSDLNDPGDTKDPGCSCRTHGGPSPAGFWFLPLLGVFLALRRRKI